MDKKINSAAIGLIFSFCIVFRIIKILAPIENRFFAIIAFFLMIIAIIFITIVFYKIFMAIANIYSGLAFNVKTFITKLFKICINIAAICIAILFGIQ